jgi:Reverse transcriptase (RNA-dependent DNA polymerase)
LSKKLRELVSDLCVYTNSEVIIVDDLLILSADDTYIDQVILMLSDSFKIKNLGNASRFLGVEIEYHREARTITLVRIDQTANPF